MIVSFNVAEMRTLHVPPISEFSKTRVYITIRREL